MPPEEPSLESEANQDGTDESSEIEKVKTKKK
jgi:hypothetical protein